jgi:hypothetical protein
MGVMVLDREKGQRRGKPDRQGEVPGGGPLRPDRRGVVRVQIVGDGDRLRLIQAEEIHDHALEGPEGLHRVQVSDVGAQEDLAADAEGDGVLEVPAHGQQGGQRPAQEDGQRREAASPTEDAGLPPHPDHHAVVGVAGDGAVVDQKSVGDAGQPLEGLPLVGADGLVGQVAAGGHHGEVQLPQQQMVQRRVGEHHPQVGVPGGHVRGHRGSGPAGEQHDGGLRPGEQRLDLRRGLAHRANLIEVPGHQGEGLVAAGLAGSQPRDGLLVPRVDHEVESPQPFDGHDLARAQSGRCPAQRRVPPGDPAVFPHLKGEVRVVLPIRIGGGLPRVEREGRAAARTRVGLGVEPAVQRVLILRLAVRAHAEPAHGGVRPVVGQGLHDGPARSAIGAVGERIAIAAIGGVQDLGEAARACGDIREDQDRFLPFPLAVADLEASVAGRVQREGMKMMDAGAGRGFPGEALQEARQGVRGAFHLDEHPLGIIPDPPGQAQLGGQPVDVRTEPHALHGALDLHPQPSPFSGHDPLDAPQVAPSAIPPTRPRPGRSDRRGGREGSPGGGSTGRAGRRRGRSRCRA